MKTAIALLIVWSVPGQPDQGLYKGVRLFPTEMAGEACIAAGKRLAASWKALLDPEVAAATRVRIWCNPVTSPDLIWVGGP